MKLSEYRVLFRLFLESEAASGKINPNVSKFTPRRVGKVNFENNGEIKELPLVIDLENVITGSCLVRTTDDNIYIVIPKKDLMSYSQNVILATCAHEIGHYICGHILGGRVSFVTQNKRKQMYYYEKHKEDDKDYSTFYMRSVFFGLLRKGVLDMEIEADIIASKYISIDQLICVHSMDLSDNSAVVVAEKVNRINILNEMLSNENLNKKNMTVTIDP